MCVPPGVHGTIHGPGHNAVFEFKGKDYVIHHFYDGTDRGHAKVQVREIKWTDDGWLNVPDVLGDEKQK